MALLFSNTSFRMLSETNMSARNNTGILRGGLSVFPWEYRFVATVLQATIFFFGFVGNILLILVVKRTRSLHTPTYCYLVSLAYADLIVLISAVPEQILSNHLYIRQWALGQVGCSVLIFGNFLGINAGSLSIVTFSIERYIAVCHTLLAQKICRTSRAKKISIGVWIFCALYCSPWLGLTQTKKPFSRYPELETCDFRLSREQYVYYFSVDITLFYFLPLAVAVYLYVQIGRVLRSRTRFRLMPGPVRSRSSHMSITSRTPSNGRNSETTLLSLSVQGSSMRGSKAKSDAAAKDRKAAPDQGTNSQAIRMLVMVVFLFALSWLPFRGVLIYNAFAQRPWLNSWYMMFAKCAIYINCSINPLLYNAMNRRFRAAFLKELRCRTTRLPPLKWAKESFVSH